MKFVAIVPTYNRSIILGKTIHSILSRKNIKGVILVVQSSDPLERKRYRKIIQKLKGMYDKDIVDIWSDKPLGSAKARKIALEKALQLFSDDHVVMMLEDDFILPSDERIFEYITHDFNISYRIACIIAVSYTHLTLPTTERV